MAIESRYQVVMLAPNADDLPSVLERTLRKRVSDLGLAAHDLVVLLADRDFDRIDYRAPIAAAYFGGRIMNPSTSAIVDELRRRGIFILPIVPSLDGFTAQVPRSLHPVNGIVPAPGDPSLEAIAQRLLEELRLIRSRRLVFVSYRRSEAARVAEQLYRAFDSRSFDVFLDTHSVRSGLEFQSVLWDQMGDADLLVLLDSPNALSSRWVAEELARAHGFGLGVLQLIWPNHRRTSGTDFCEAEYLRSHNFEPPVDNPDENSQLSVDTLNRVVTLAESLRARAFAARRTKVVGELCQRAARAGFAFAVQSPSCIDLSHAGKSTVRAFPVVGHPDSAQLNECFDGCDVAATGILVYDPVAAWERRRRHLGWLNDYLPVKSVPVTDLGAWLTAL
jgi:hypothetical protein